MVITAISAPSQVRSGAAFLITATVQNTGGTAGWADVSITPGGIATGSAYLQPGASQGIGVSVVMPNADTTFTATCGSSSKTVFVEVIMPVATSLTLSLSPASVAPNGSVVASGALTRGDGGSTSGLTVSVDGVSGTTGSGGAYSITFTAPSTSGTKTITASFGGTTLLLPSSTQARLNVFGGIAGANWLLLAPFLLGGILLYISRR